MKVFFESLMMLIDDSLLYGLATLGVGLIALIVRYSFRSKCTNVSLCYGLVAITRDIEGEIESTEIENTAPVQRQTTNESTSV